MFRLTKTVSRSLKNSIDVQLYERYGCTRRDPIVGFVWVLVIALMMLGVSITANAQSLYGSITGNVTDQEGAAVVGAKGQLQNIGTGVTVDTITDERGGYQFNTLQPALYKLTISANSFKTVVQDNVKIDATQVRRADAQLEVAKVA